MFWACSGVDAMAGPFVLNVRPLDERDVGYRHGGGSTPQVSARPHALAACGRGPESAAPGAGSTPSPRVFVVRSATSAAANRKTLDASSARWKPDVSASGAELWLASRSLVRDVAMAVKIA